MAYIDPDGMFGGDRMALLSDRGRYYWPWIWVASNTVGRIELNYRKIAETVFRQFKHRPSEDEFWQVMQEFHQAFLMFVYRAPDGRMWGQWAVSEKYLPTYKIKADAATPAPPHQELNKWVESYVQAKVSASIGKCPLINNSENVLEVQKTFPKFYSRDARAIGEERRGEERNTSSSTEAVGVLSSPISPASTEEPPAKPAPGKKLPTGSWMDAQFNRWYAVYWRHVGKIRARAAFAKSIRLLNTTGLSDEDAVEFLIAQCIEDRKRHEPTQDWDWRRNLHPATWLNEKRWEDEANTSSAPGLARKLTPLEKLQAREKNGKNNI